MRTFLLEWQLRVVLLLLIYIGHVPVEVESLDEDVVEDLIVAETDQDAEEADCEKDESSDVAQQVWEKVLGPRCETSVQTHAEAQLDLCCWGCFHERRA